jgi:hypothetical protein
LKRVVECNMNGKVKRIVEGKAKSKLKMQVKKMKTKTKRASLKTNAGKPENT